MNEGSSRRLFVKQTGLGVGGLLLAQMVPERLFAAHRTAAGAAASGEKFTFLTAEEAADVKAFAAQVIPTDDTPGANEANVVYFIDNIITNYDPDIRGVFRNAIRELNQVVGQEAGEGKRFASLAPEKQIEVMHRFEQTDQSAKSRPAGIPGDFELLRALPIVGFLSDPELGGNKDMVGWQLTGFDGIGMHEPPFGYYDAELLKTQKQGGEL